MEIVRDVLTTLARRYAFRDLAYLVGSGAADSELTQREAARVQQLCEYGQRLFDLDAEDFANRDAAVGANTDVRRAHLIDRGRLSRIPQSPHERPRAALFDLVPAYRLLLEVIAARWSRRETSALVAAVHIAAEYAPRGGLASAVMTDDGFPLPGLPSLFGALAATDVTPDTLLADTAAEIVSEFDSPKATLVR